MLRPPELAAVERQPAGIACLGARDEQKVLTRQGVVGQSDTPPVKRQGDCALEVRAARGGGVRDDGGSAPGLRPGDTRL